jgi:ABC-type multidrug transport system ATPase subunit
MAPHDLVAPQPVESEVIIETRGLSRVYPGVTALDNVNYRVYRNKVNVLIGENGAGKSTMMKMLAGVETPSSGQIILDGEADFKLYPSGREIRHQHYFPGTEFISQYECDGQHLHGK